MAMKLNLASGQRPFGEGWTNIDIKDQGYPVDILTDIKDLSMIEDGSVEVIVLHHVVEHIAIHELNDYIREWRRVLKEGGRMAIFAPNLKEINKAWVEGRISTFIHNVNTFGAYQDSIHDLHKWGYDYEELIHRIGGRNEQTGEYSFSWKARVLEPHIVQNDPIYRGSDVAFDWWILAVEFEKGNS